MKKLLFFAVVAMMMVAACGNKSKTAEGADADSLTADSVAEAVQDTTPQPMFIFRLDDDHMQMVYWADRKEPQKTKDNAEYYEEQHGLWALQEIFRRNRASYTKMLMPDGKTFADIKYVEEITKNPDGEEMYGGELHGRADIPAPGLRYMFFNKKGKKMDEIGMYIAVTESYLQTRKLIPMPLVKGKKPLPQQVVKQLEKQYKMKAESSELVSKGDLYGYGVMQFAGAYRTIEEYGEKRQTALALVVIMVGDSVYSYPVEGHYDKTYGATWNVDDDGEYIASSVTMFEGPNGIECCFVHGAPESLTVGMFRVVGGKLERQVYETYHVLIDESQPLWKKDIAKLRQLYLEDDPSEHKGYKLTKYRFIYIDDNDDSYDHPEIWMRADDNKHGAFFTYNKGKFQLMGCEDERMHPTFYKSRNGVGYLTLSGTAGGASIFINAIEVKDDRIVHRLDVLKDEGRIIESTMDDKPYNSEKARQYLENLPETEDIIEYWTEIQE